MFFNNLEPSILPLITNATQEEVNKCMEDNKKYCEFVDNFGKWLNKPSDELKEKLFGKGVQDYAT